MNLNRTTRVFKRLFCFSAVFSIILLNSQNGSATLVHPPEHYNHYYALLIGSDEWVDEPLEVEKGLLGWYNWRSIGSIEYMKQPSNLQILEKLNEYTTKVSDNDFFLFWYSGHGEFEKDAVFRENEKVAEGKALDKFDEGLWNSAMDTIVYDDQIADSNFMGGIKGDKLAVFANCFSGGMWGGNDEGDLEKLSRIAVYASSTELQKTAADSSFVNGLIEGLKTKKADADQNLHLTIGEWYIYGNSKNQGELVTTYDVNGNPIGRTPVKPQYFDNPNMRPKYVAYDNIPEPSTLILLGSGLAFSAWRFRRKK